MFQSLSEYRCESDCDTSVDIRQNALYYSGHSYFRLSVHAEKSGVGVLDSGE